MHRRTLLAGLTTAATTTGLTGCAGAGNGTDGTSDGTSEATGDADSDTSLTTESATDHLRTVYEAWAALDADAFLATLHTTNNHPEAEVRNGAEEIGFEGQLAALNAEVLGEDIGSETITTLFERGPNLSRDDVDTFTDVRTVHFRVAPAIDGETTTDAGEKFKSFLETEKEHLVAAEDGTWRFVL